MNQGFGIDNSGAWNAYRSNLYHFVHKRIADRADAEDIVQDVLIKAYTNLQTLKDGSKLQSWLYQIARNAIIDHYRQFKPTDELSESLLEPMANVMAKIDDSSEAEFSQCLVPFIEQLPPEYREALRLAEIQGATQQQVAIAQGISLSGAKSRVQRGRKLLKSILLQCCQVELDQRGVVSNFQPQGKCGACACTAQ